MRVQHSDAFPSVWQKHPTPPPSILPSDAAAVAAQSPKRGGIQDVLYADWNAVLNGGGNETKMEWTLRC